MFATETMLVKGINDAEESLNKTAKVISELKPDRSYILIPIRPPSEKFVESPSEENLNTAYQIFSSTINDVELLVHNEGTDFNYSSNAEKELLSILAVHPMRKDAVEYFLVKADNNWKLIEDLIQSKKIKQVFYNEDIFFVNSN